MICGRVFLILLAAATFASGCSAPNGNSATGDPLAERESRQTNSLKTQYKSIINGTDPQGTRLDVFVDVDRMYSMDEDSEAAMKAQILKTWERAWTSAHPGKHATLRIRLRNYFGEDVYTKTVSV